MRAMLQVSVRQSGFNEAYRLNYVQIVFDFIARCRRLAARDASVVQLNTVVAAAAVRSL